MIGVRVCGCGEKLTWREVGDSRVETNTLPGGSGYSVGGNALLYCIHNHLLVETKLLPTCKET